jgi:YidC/Oxa1 family membrane protein insertase
VAGVIPLARITSPIEDVLQSVLEWLHGSLGLSWAWAIVAITAIVRLVILPLTLKQIRSMQRLQQYAPELKALQQKYKNDKQRLNEEVMKFYREHKVNPAASCLPILPQIPIFISLFYLLRDFEKDVFPRFPESSRDFLNGLIPDITQHVNEHWSGWMLLVVYVGSQLLSLILSTTSVQSKTQRYVLLALPFIFIPFIVRFPVGLMIYWVTTNLWTVGQGAITRKLYPRPLLELPKRTSRTPPKGGEPGGDGAKAKPKPTKPVRPEAKRPPAPADGSSPARPVRRRKKKGPRTRR